MCMRASKTTWIIRSRGVLLGFTPKNDRQHQVLVISPVNPLSGGPLEQLLRGAPAEAAYVRESEDSVNVSLEPLLASLVPWVPRTVAAVLAEVEVWLGPSPPLNNSVARNLVRGCG